MALKGAASTEAMKGRKAIHERIIKRCLMEIIVMK